jgi:hypothetical protein
MLKETRAKKRKRTNIGGASLPQLASQSPSQQEFPVCPIPVSDDTQVKTEDTANHETIIISDDEEFNGLDNQSDASGELERHVVRAFKTEFPQDVPETDLVQPAHVESDSSWEWPASDPNTSPSQDPMSSDLEKSPNVASDSSGASPVGKLAPRSQGAQSSDPEKHSIIPPILATDSSNEEPASKPGSATSQDILEPEYQHLLRDDSESNHSWLPSRSTTPPLEDDLESSDIQYLPLEDAVPTHLEYRSWLNHEKLTFYNFASKIELVLHAKEDMRCVTVKLVKYFSYYHITFFTFLAWAIDCILPRNMEILTVTATYPWTPRQHVFRRNQVNDDFETFKKHLREGAARDPEIEIKGCEIEMVLEVELRETGRETM